MNSNKHTTDPHNITSEVKTPEQGDSLNNQWGECDMSRGGGKVTHVSKGTQELTAGGYGR